MGAQRDGELTAKQQHFCRCLASGMTQAAAYREAYNVGPHALKKSQQEADSRMMRQEKIRSRVQALIKAKEAAMVASALSDRERVLAKLRYLLDNATPGDAAKLRAAELLGKSVGLFKDVVETSTTDRTSEDIAAEIEERLAAFIDGAGTNDMVELVDDTGGSDQEHQQVH